jgi:mono/diheme cytochrome c family protein
MSYKKTSIKAAFLLVFGFMTLVACGDAGDNVTNRNSANANSANNSAAANSSTNSGAAASGARSDAETASAGAVKLYGDSCAGCHKEDGKGGKMTVEGKTIDPDDLTSAKMAGKTDDQLYKYIANGIPDEGMPAFKDKLSDAEIKSLVAHIRELQKAKS